MMNRLYSLVFFLPLALANSSWAQITMVRATACGPGSFPRTCTIPAAASGNLIVIGWQANGGSNTATTITSVTDSVGNSYVEAGAARAIDTAIGTIADIWYAKNIAAGATSVTITPSMSISSGNAVIWEFAGADPTAPLSQTATLNSQPASTSPVGAAVSASAGDAIVTTSVVGMTVTGIYPGNPFVIDSLQNGNAWSHLLVSTSGTYSAQWTQPNSATYNNSTVSFRAAQSSSTTSACDLNKDGVTNVVDGQLAVNMSLGLTTCTANIAGAGICNSTVVQRIMNAALGSSCVTDSGTTPPASHSVTLSWTASTSSNLSGYNVYRSTTSGGAYAKVNTALVSATSYTDANVQAGQTYYYVATAIDTSSNESAYSNQAQATVPSP
jgi:hypothetical protein